MRDLLKQRPSVWLMGILLVPVVLIGLGLMAVGTWQARGIGCGLLAVAAIAMLRLPGKNLGLLIGLLVWLLMLVLGARLLAALRVGHWWALERMRALARKSKATRESEWVYVGRHAALLALGAVLAVFTVAMIWTRRSEAWTLVWIHMLLGMPFSVPFMFYWADAVRPNLIYRHRFERLVVETPEGVV